MEKQHKYINPLTDFGFKRIFGTEANSDLLIDFLNCTLPLKSKITQISYRNSEQIPNISEDRKAIFDLFCTNENKEEFIIEMQKGKLTYFKDRSLYYLTFPIQRMAEKGDWDYKLSPIYYLAILDFFYEHESEAKVEREVQLIDNYQEIFYDKLLIKFIQLQAFNKTEAELSSRKEQWFYFLKHLEDMESNMEQLFKKDQIFAKGLTIAEIAKLSYDEHTRYQISRTQYIEIREMNKSSYNDGLSAGNELLEDERRQKEEALAKVEEKEIQKRNAAKAILQSGLSKEEVAKAFSISLDELDVWLNHP